MSKREVYDFTDMLHHAESMGYDWNQACDILACFDCAPELKTFGLELSELDYMEKNHPDAVKIARSWFESIGSPPCVELI